MFKKLSLKLILVYQTFISPLLGSDKCRYYPSCSEYSKQVFLFCNPFLASFLTFLRILKCNQLFKGGIDYPKIKMRIVEVVFEPIILSFWLIPTLTQTFDYKNIILKKRKYPLQSYYVAKIFPKASRV